MVDNSGQNGGSGDSTRVSLTGERAIVARLFAVLSESLDPDKAACALFETPTGEWTTTVDTRDPLDRHLLRALVADVAGPEIAGKLVWETVAAKDWAKASLAGLVPVTAGRFIVHGSHDRAKIGPNKIGIEIEAALAFGTGHHGTTRGCLLALDCLLKAGRPRRVFDVGTGTGVLAIAVARTTRQRVLASDIDAVAVVTARANARGNKVGSLVRVLDAAGLYHRDLRRGGYDLVFANILLGPLLRLARPIRRIVAPGGRVILSGLLASHTNAARSAYAMQGLALERRIDLDGWGTLILRRQGAKSDRPSARSRAGAIGPREGGVG